MKLGFLKVFHDKLDLATTTISKSRIARDKKAKEVNLLTNSVKSQLAQKVLSLPLEDRTNHALTLQYCFSVATLEYRHKVWSYEYMAFSRRVGELWEAFCSAAWDSPSRLRVSRIPAPNFGEIRDILQSRLYNNIGNHPKRNEILDDTETMFTIIGDINMAEDEVLEVDGIPCVIDFKSGFGSNEKGNMLRLQAVGRAYRVWNKNTRLLLLVRQDENNNYLNILKKSGLWEVHTGIKAYKQISDLTGADMNAVRSQVISWEKDLSPELYDFLKNQPSDLSSYLDW